MNIQFRHRCLSMMLVLVMLFTMSPVSVIAEEEHDHSHDEAVTVLEVADLSVSASASASHVYVGDGAVNVTAKITGGLAPYEVTLQAVRNGEVAATDTVTTSAASAQLTFVPKSYGDYELVVVVHDALHTQELVSRTLTVAEHDEESEQDWAASVSGATLSSNWGRSLLSVAKTQVGYTESEKDFVLKNGARQGYSRYGAWYGTPYGSWNNAFLAFVAEYAGIPNDAFLSGSSYRSWVNGMSAKGAYELSGSGYAPKAGDVAFLSGSRVAIIESVSGSNVTVIEGDVDGAVVRKTYALSKVAGIGNTTLLMGLHTGGATPVPTEAPEVTKAPEGVATATPAPTAKPTATVVPEEEELTFQATPTPGPGVTVAPKDDENPLGSVIGQVGDTVEQLQAAATSVPTQFSEAYYLMKDEMAKLVEKYLGTATPTKADIKAFVDGLGMQEVYYIVSEIDEVLEYAANVGVSERELNALGESEECFISFVLSANDRFSQLMQERLEGSYSLLNGLLTVTYESDDSSTSTKFSKTNETAVSLGLRAQVWNEHHMTVTFTNNASYDAKISYTVTSSNVKSFSGTVFPTVNGTVAGIEIPSGGSISGTVTAASNFSLSGLPEVAMTITAIALTEIVAVPQVTFDYDATLGSITVAGTPVGSGEKVDIVSADGAVLVATANNSTFYGWVDADGAFLSAENTFTYYPKTDTTVYAVFDKASPAVWTVDGKPFADLNKAAIYALGSSSKVAVLSTDYTLPAGEYTIPKGATVLIPYDANNTLKTTVPAYANSYSQPTAYRTLTMAEGANITVNGAISVGGQQSAAGGTAGHPYGTLGFIRMQDGSKITLNDGSALYVWGYIVGDGEIDALSGSTVYEDFQLEDWRGGSATTGMIGNDQRVFPMSQYYVQNIEVPLKLYAGASEYGFMSIYAAYQLAGAEVPFIGPKGLFRNTSGYVIKDYIESEDRLRITISGSASIASLSITMSIVGTITSQEYVLPLNGSITIDVLGGSNISLAQDLALHPGSQFYVRQGATINLSSGNNIFVYDLDDWKATYLYNSQTRFKRLKYAPGRTGEGNRDVDAFIQIDGTINAANSYAYTTKGHANIYSTGAGKVTVLVGSQTDTYQALQVDTDITYETVALDPAYLKNADGSYTPINGSTMYIQNGDEYIELGTQSSGTVVNYAYNKDAGMWIMECDTSLDTHYFVKQVVAPTCDTQGYDLYVCQCGANSVQQNITDALGHTYAVAGYETDATDYCLDRTCTVCGTVKPGTGLHNTGLTYTCVDATCTICGTTVPSDGKHDYTFKVETVAPTCTTDGYTRGTCACGAYQDSDVVAAAHTYAVTATVNAAQDADGKWSWSWTGAADAVDCTADGSVTFTCSVCDASTSGHTYTDTIKAPGHDWDSGVKTAPTCYAEGYTTYTCKRCGEVENRDSVATIDHTYGEETVVEATCITGGYTYKICQVEKCQYKDIYNETEATGKHVYAATPDANVKEDGNGGYVTKTCTVDGSVVYACTTTGCTDNYTETIKAPGHIEVTLEAVAATCDKAGLTEGKYCSVCKETLVKQDEIPALGFSFVVDEEASYDATCTEKGLKVEICTNGCNHIVKTDVDALGHDFSVEVSRTESTCSTAGVVVNKCVRCDETEETKLALAAHNYGENGYTSKEAPTCSTPGYIHYDCQYADCTEKPYKAVDPEYPTKVDHNQLSEYPGEAATCTTAGWTDGKKCSWCGAVSVERTEIPALGHKVETWNVIAKATCKAAGEQSGVCTTCTETVTETIPMVVHDADYQYTKFPTVPETCQQDGYLEYTYCSACDINITEKTILPKKTGEGYCSYVLVKGTPATCTEDGLSDGYKCEWCDTWQVGKEQTVIDAIHDTIGGIETAQPATCITNGHDVGSKYCSVCATWFDDKVLTATGIHDYTITVQSVAATCDDDAYTIKQCSVDQACTAQNTFTEEGSAKGHDYQVSATSGVKLEGEEYVLVNCKVAGSVTYTCANDNTHTYTVTDLYQAKDDHSGEWNVITDSTCQAEGSQERTCTACDEHETAVIEKKDHTGVENAYTEVAEKKATCLEAGHSAYTKCNICNLEIGKVTEGYEIDTVNGHDYQTVTGKAADCYNDGLTDGVQCTICKEWKTEQTVIKAGHPEDQITTLTEAIPSTHNTQGYPKGSRKCEKCGDWTTTSRLPLVTECNWIQTAHQDATCYAEGYTTYECEWFDECGKTKTVTHAKIDHAYDAGVGSGMELVDGEWVRKDCLTAGTVTYTCTNDGCTAEAEGHSYTDSYEALADHSGTWKTTKEATCVEAGAKERTCTACEAYETAVIDILVHTEADAYTEYEELKATCMVPGYSAYKHCNICNLDIGKTDYEIDAVNGHDYQLVEGKEAGCDTTGLEMAMQCIYCSKWQDMEGNDIEAQPVIPAKHSQISGIEEAIPVTCYQDGHSAGSKYCPDCSTWFEGETTTMVECDVQVKEHVKATCTADGYTINQCLYYTGNAEECDNTETITLTKLGHEWEREGAETKWVETKAATCYATGVLTWTCECDEQTTDVIPMIAHTYNNGVPGKETTKWNETTSKWENCVETDTIVYTCQNEGCTAENSETHTYTVDIAVTEHAWVYDAQDEPTCTEPGTASGKHCTRCSLEEGGGEIPAKGHTWDAGVGTGAKWDDEAQKWVTTSCTEDGSVLYTCTLCTVGEYTKTEIVTAPGHDWDEGTVAVEATCIKAGSTTYKCTACGEEDTRVDIPATNIHDKTVEIPGNAATCTESGMTTGWKCSMCDAVQVKQNVISAIHDTIEGITEAIPATCITAGHDVGSKYCDECGKWFDDKVLEATGVHSYTNVIETVEATCDADGYIIKQCTADAACTAQETFANGSATDHAWTVSKTDGVVADGNGGWKLVKCDVAGSVTYVCGNDASHTKTEPVEATGHQHTEVIPGQAATCLEDGYEDGLKCTDCGTVITEREVIKAKGEHTWGAWSTTTEAKCGVAGEERRDCDLCDAYETNELAALEHDYDWDGGKVVTEMTCLTDGKTTYICQRCSEEWVDPASIQTAPGSHDPIIVPAVDPICGTAGATEGVKCDRCDEWIEEPTEVPALDHLYDDGVILEGDEPTCEGTGLKTFTCTRETCKDTIEGHTKTEIVSATGHDIVIDKAVEATCTSTGLTEGQHCTKCDDKTIAQTLVEKKPHTEEEIPAVEVTCEVDGYSVGVKCSVCGTVLVEPELTEKAHHLDLHQVAAQAPECEKIGWDAYEYCTKCDYTTYVEKPALEHKKVTVKGYAETCTEDGLTDGEQCELCDKWFTEQQPIPASHKPVDVAEVKVTCTSDGCTAGKKCSVCGEILEGCEVVKTEGHKEEILEAKDATCTADGLTEGKKCSVCGEITVAQETVTKLGHKYTDLPAVEPTCTEDGLTRGSWCDRCGTIHLAQETIKTTGHNIVTDAAVEATCTATGLTEGSHCTKCDAMTVKQEIIPMKAHTEEEIPAVAVTCLVDGKTAGKKCSVCGAVTVEPEIIPAEGHKPVEIPAVKPTCTEDGKKAGEKCSVCGIVTVPQAVDPATGHTDEILPAVEATCTTAGKTEGLKCSVCDTVLKKQETVAATGHTNKTVTGYAATCTEDGLSDGVQCSVCNTWIVEQTVITALGHEEVIREAVEATCEETGLTQGEYCSVCKEELVKQEIIPAKGHTVVIDAAVAPTCTKTGLTEGKHCSVCNKVLTAQETVDATGHTPVADPAVEPTCTETGKTAGSHCEVCGTILEEQKTINATGHTEIIDKAKPATCTESGLTEGKHCGVCNETLLAQEVIPATNHANKAPGEAKDATCTENGNTAGLYCPDCQTWLEAQEVIPATNHANKAPGEAKEETCTEDGNTAGLYCPDCQTWLEAQEVIPATGHKMDEGVETTPHTCTEAGELTYTCLNGCGYTETEEVPAAHTPVVIEAVAPTCTTDGASEGSKCSVCEEVLVAPTVVPAAHTWEDVEILVEATCTEDGSKSVRCAVEGCGVTETIVIPATGHTEVIDPAKAATCEEDGLTAGKHCSVCNEVLIAQKVVAGGHRWNYAPCTAAGATCSRCKKVNEEMLEHDMAPATCTEASVCKYGCGKTEGEALGHTEVIIEEIPAMCEEPGWTSGKMCSVCDAIIEAPKVIPALNHKIVKYDAKKPTFTSPGWDAYEACDFCAYSTKVEIPALGVQTISSYSEFMKYLPWLEKWAVEFAKTHPETDPVDLVIKYIRTGVDRYNSGSWGIMAGYENAEFAKYVSEQEDLYNQQYDNIDDMVKVSGLKNLDNFKLPNGDLTDIGHMFGTMDITYNNDCGVNHADVGGWAGDLVDLLSTADHTDHTDVIASANGEFEALVDVIRYELLGHSFSHSDVFSQTDLYGDLDAFYVMKNLDFENYKEGDMAALFNSYFTLSLNDVDRAGYLLEHRLNGVATRSAVRDAVYTAYTSNNVISTLEGTRDFNASDLTILRQAVCYAFADYLCELAGDYVDVTENPYLTVFQSEHQQLAPGISMEIHMANSADDKQMVYYLAYASVGREDVDIMANYNERYVTHWEMSRVLDQANSTQELYSNPESEHYIENFNVVTAINGAGFNMHTGEPGGLLVMHGEQYHPIDGNGFFGMHEDGYAVIGTTEEYNTKYKGKIVEAIAGFGTMLVKDGELAITATSDYYANRASRTAVGITRTGKVVFMVLDGRQEPWSCGGSMIEIAQIMKNAGCVQAINLDGGGSTTFVARQEGDESLSVVNRPSDGVARSVSTGLVMISTAPSSTAFDHAVVESDYSFLTVDSTVQMTAKGVSATGNVVDLPEGAFWAVSDENVGTIDENGVFTAKSLGSVEIRLMLDEAVLGYKTLNVVVPDMLYFTREKIDGVYGATIELPLKARYQGKEVAFNANDIAFTLSNDTIGKMEGLAFKAVEESEITNVTITAALASDSEVNAQISIVLFKQGENSFDFDQATGGSRILAWSREVSNTNTADNSVYYVINPEEDMVTTYTIALDMTQIPIPKRLDDLIYMLPGADMEGASAWTFLLQLAERISVLTTVKPKVQIDPNFDVDYSELKLINDYFELNGTEFDEETNTLTMTLNWIDQTQPIPVETANPLCMVTGLKLIPKDDAAWNDKDQLKPVNKGTVSYTIYMRASGLYSFSQKPENQETFGLYPFVNPNDESEKGGYFKDTYAEFEDSYTLVRSLKNGWYTEDSGFRYYVNGVYHTGVQQADGLFYDFGENGINVGKKTYTGLHVMDGNTYYIQAGEIGKGWNIIGDDWYYFDTTTGIGLNGDHMVSGHVYPFENGKVLHGVWVNDGVGLKYYYGPGNYYAGWRVIEGKEYFFEKNYAKTGITPVQESHDTYEYWYEFTETGAKVGFAPDGLHWYNGELYYIENGLADHEGLYYVDGNYYNFVVYSHYAVRAAKEGEFKTFWVYAPNDTGKPEGMYRFDHLGRVILTNEIVEENGTLYYYEDGTRANNKGLVYFEENYYYIQGGGVAVQDAGAWVTNTNGLDVKTGYYRFDENGHMIMDTAVVLESDGLYHYYEEGRRVYTEGLVEVDGDYYYIQSNGTAITDTEKYVSKTNGLKPKGTYYFGTDGKLIDRLPGDADGDKDVDLDDAVLVFEYGAGEEVTIYLFNADVNDDDKVDAKDALLIMQYDAGWDVTLK